MKLKSPTVEFDDEQSTVKSADDDYGTPTVEPKAKATGTINSAVDGGPAAGPVGDKPHTVGSAEKKDEMVKSVDGGSSTAEPDGKVSQAVDSAENEDETVNSALEGRPTAEPTRGESRTVESAENWNEMVVSVEPSADYGREMVSDNSANLLVRD